MTYRISAQVCAPIVLRGPLNLEGLVVYAEHKTAGTFDTTLRRGSIGSRGAPSDESQCLDYLEHAGQRICLCTDLMHDGAYDAERWAWSRRVNGEDALWYTGKPPSPSISTAPRLVCTKVWWDFVGAPQTVLSLLRTHITHIGKLRAHGYGAVHSWAVAKRHVEADVLVAHGRLRRALPADWVQSRAEPVQVSVRVPSWHRANLVLGYRGDTEGELLLNAYSQP